MKCSICGKKTSLNHKAKNGKICDACCYMLPEFVLRDLKKIRVEDIRVFCDIFRYTSNAPFLYGAGKLKLTENEIIFDRGMIPGTSILSQIAYTKLKSVRMEFIPRKKGPVAGCAYGELCLILTLKYKNFVFRTKIIDLLLKCRMSNGQFIPEFTSEISRLESLLYFGIHHGTLKYINEFHKKESSNRHSESDDSSNSDRKQGTHKNTSGADHTLNAALNYFGLQIPFSNEELKKKYRELIRKCHPDQKIVDARLKAEDVNTYYDYLKKFAT